MTYAGFHSGWIEVVCGPMFSGKTEELIRRMRRAQIAKQRVAIFKPKVDNRYSETDIVSHNKNKLPSFMVEDPTEILEHSYDAHVVGIDEAQFFDERLLSIARKMAHGGKRVILAGLDKDYMAKPFGSMPQLIIEADDVTKILAICMKCGAPANFSQRLTKKDGQVLVGETDHYEARCRRCFDWDSI